MDIEAKVKQIIVNKLNVSEDKVVPEASFINDLAINYLKQKLGQA